MSIISVQELLALLLVAGKAVVASKAVSAEPLLVAGKKDSAELLLVAGKAISAELLFGAGKAISAELLLVAGKAIYAELLLVSGKVSEEVDEKEASGLINVCKELDSSLSTIIFPRLPPFYLPFYHRWLLEKTKTVRKQRCW